MKSSLVLLLVMSAATLVFCEDGQASDQKVDAFENKVQNALNTLNEAFGQDTETDPEKRAISKRGWFRWRSAAVGAAGAAFLLGKRSSEDGVTGERLQEVQGAINTLETAAGVAAIGAYGEEALKHAKE